MHFLHGGRNTVGKNPTTYYHLVDLASTVDGGIGALRREYPGFFKQISRGQTNVVRIRGEGGRFSVELKLTN